MLVLAIAAAVSAGTADTDGSRDLASLGSRVATDCLQLRWQFTLLVVVLAGLHYLATAVATRASVGLSLRLRETMLVQLAAAAANRLTPAGLGGSAVNARFFCRRGADKRGAVTAVATLSVLGAVADLLVLSVLVFSGRLLGLGGGAHELAVLASKLARYAAPFRSPWMWLALAVVALGAGLFRLLCHPSVEMSQHRLLGPVLGLGRDPRRLCVLLLASGSTTLVLAFAFVASIAMVPGAHPQASTGALLVAFMAGSAAGNAMPIPAGIGSADIAFVGVLVTVHVPAAHALEVVVLFRLITFWLPAVLGVLATRQLRRAGAI